MTRQKYRVRLNLTLAQFKQLITDGRAKRVSGHVLGGRVSDQNGVSMVGAEVSVRHVATGICPFGINIYIPFWRNTSHAQRPAFTPLASSILARYLKWLPFASTRLDSL